MLKKIKEYQPAPTILFDKKVRLHPDLTFGEKVFLAEVQAMNQHDSCPYSVKTLSEFFNVSHVTIMNWVKKLVNMGLLEVTCDYSKKGCKHFLKVKN